MVSDIEKILRKEILEDDIEVRNQFVSIFREDISSFIYALSNAYRKWEKYDSQIGQNKRKAYVSAFLFDAINSLTLSLKLFLSGYTVPSGNLFRHTIESICLAILCSNENLPYYQKVDENKFSAKSAVNCLVRNSKKLKINKEAVLVLKKSYEFYHKYSHSTLLSLIQNISLSKRGDLYIGPSFDEGKMMGYKKEVKTRANLAEVFGNVIDGIFMIEKGNS